MKADELRQHLDDAPRPNPPGDVDRQAFPRELVDHRQALETPAVGTGIEHEIVRPDVIRLGGKRRATPAASWSEYATYACNLGFNGMALATSIPCAGQSKAWILRIFAIERVRKDTLICVG